MSCEFIKSRQDRVLWVPVGVPHTEQRLVAGLCHARSSWFGIGALNSLPMSALGQKRTLKRLDPMSALPPKADMDKNGRYVRFSNRPVGVKHFQALHDGGVGVAHGL